jgi:hypothetical protein
MNHYNHLKRVNEYLFSILTNRQVEEFLDWEQQYDMKIWKMEAENGMDMQEAIDIIVDQYYDDERKDWEESDRPRNHAYYAIRSLMGGDL